MAKVNKAKSKGNLIFEKELEITVKKIKDLHIKLLRKEKANEKKELILVSNPNE